MSTFVSVGNATQPFERLLSAVVEIAHSLPQPVIVQHGNTPFSGGGGCIEKSFVNPEDFQRLLTEAELVIMHAGAGSVIHAILAGKVPIVVPRRGIFDELIDDHQMEFASALAETGKVILVKETGCLIDAVRHAQCSGQAIESFRQKPKILNQIAEVLKGYAVSLGE